MTMKRTAAIALLCALFATALAGGKGRVPVSEWPDSLRSVDLYTEGIKLIAIRRDSAGARRHFTEAIRRDSTYAPAYYELAVNGMYATPEEAVALIRRACELDTANRWYHRFYGQILLYAERYAEALRVYRDLTAEDPSDPDNYRLLAALYEQQQQPYAAIVTLDSAELRFGRIPALSATKRRLLIATRQFDKALEEAQALVDEAPYEARNHSLVADIYGNMGKDSLAAASFERAMQLDSTDIPTLMSLSDFYNARHDYRNLLGVSRRLFALDAVPLETKIRNFEQYTSDIRFYREYYFQLNDLASTLAIRYPDDKRVVKLYADHLIASGELERALALYKIQTAKPEPDPDHFKYVIDIESYLQHPDSANLYVERALELFPDKPEFHISKGHALIYSKRYAQAIDSYRESLRLVGTDSLRGTIWGYIGDAWHQRAIAADSTYEISPQGGGNAAFRRAMKECYKAYDRSLRYYADNASILNNYAYFLSLEERDLEKALDMAERATALVENNSTFLDTRAWVLFRLGRIEEARKTVEQAIALDRNESAELLVHYGDILFALNQRFLAETYWRKALDKGYDADAIQRRIERSREKPTASE